MFTRFMFDSFRLTLNSMRLLFMFDLGIKKRGSLYLLLVPLLKALALPIEVERATQKPTPNMLIASPFTRQWQIYISH